MLVCGPFHSVANLPVGLPYLRSYLEQKGISCALLDLNIESRDYLLETISSKPLVDRLFSQSCRTYLAEAMAWSWHDPQGPDATVKRIHTHTSDLLREFWEEMQITRLTHDPLLREASELLRSWLLGKCREIAELDTGWVGFSTTITNLAANLFLAQHLKELNSDLFIILGGPECTNRNAQELLRSFAYIDAVIPAPAYEPLANVLAGVKRGLKGPLPPGVYRRTKQGDIEFDDTSCWIALDKLPPANWDGIDLGRYQAGFFIQDTKNISQWYPTIPLHTSQGCSYNRCGFCYNTTLYSRFGAQSPKRVVAEIEHQIEKVGSRSFFFTDFEFNALPDRVQGICRLIRNLSDEIRFYIWLRLDKVDMDLLKCVYDAGCRQAFVGVEAVDDDLLQQMNKGYDADTAIEKLRVLHDFCETYPDMLFKFNLIADYPGESLESVKNTLTRVAENFHLFYRRVAAVVKFMLYEGTPCFRDLAPDAIGCLEPLLPPLANLRSYRYIFPRPNDPTRAERIRIWSAIQALVQRDA